MLSEGQGRNVIIIVLAHLAPAISMAEASESSRWNGRHGPLQSFRYCYCSGAGQGSR